MEDESTGPSATKNSGETEKEDSSNEENDDDFNPTLAAMETELNQKSKTVLTLTKEYTKLIKYQKDKLNCVLNSQIFHQQKKKLTKKLLMIL